MSVESTHFFQSVRADQPYTHKQQVAIPSLGTYYNGLRVPNLLLTALYCLDSKTGELAQNIKLIFQTDGPSEAQLNFKHDALTHRYKHRIYLFDVNMDIVFGQGIVQRNGVKVNGAIGAEKVVKGGLDVGVESSIDTPGPITSIHARIEGILSANEGKLDAWGKMTGAAIMNRSY
jgi:hypothetical protein